MTKTIVVNCKTEIYDVYIGRGSKWGNPFSHLKDSKADFITSSREESIDLYRMWITVGEGRYLLNHLDELDGKRIGCFCKPKKCHGDILVDLISSRIKD